MSVQFDQAPQLTYAQQEAVQRQYDARVKSSTTAFLLCYFLGVFGAHRIYLGQWGAAALRLLLPLIAIGFAILGVLDVLSFATFSLAAITLLCALIWEALDLARIDSEVSAANAALMDRLLATVPPAGYSFSTISERSAISTEPPTQPERAPVVAKDAGIAAAALGASGISTPSAPSTPEPEPLPLTFEPEPAPDSPSVPQQSAIPSDEPSTATLPPTASAYVPPVAPEIVTGGFATSAAPQPESPPIWPGAPDEASNIDTAPEWPGVSATPPNTPATDEADTQTQPVAPQVASQGQPETSESPVALEDIAAAVIAPLAGAAAEASRTASLPETPPASPQEDTPRLKHIRVRRKIMLDDGTVVGEQVLEDDFPIEMDKQEAAKILEARFQQTSLEEIARQANLPPGTELQLRRE
jgi:TM2 domain-containing membrane protein YozV